MFLFISIFPGINLAGNFYVFHRLLSFWQIKWNIGWLALWAMASCGYTLFSFLDHVRPHWLWHELGKLFVCWLGVGFLCLCCLAVHDLLWLAIRFPIQTSRWLVCGAIAGICLYAFVNSFFLRVQTIQVQAPVNLKIAQISDLHLGSVSQRYCKRAIDRVNQLSPDLVAFTGDLLDPHSTLDAQTLRPLESLKPPAYWVSGNHERYAGLSKVKKLIRNTPLQPLENQAVLTNGIQLIGIEDSDSPEQVAIQLMQIPRQKDVYTVLLYHQPTGLEDAAQAGIDLMLCGHTHRGQIFPFGWLVQMKYPRLYGWYKYENCGMYVSSGTGFWGPPMRLGSRNEIVLIQLQKKE